MPSISPKYNIEPLPSRHTTWPYTPSDFTRQDPSPDTTFYSTPRFVTHIDDAAISSLCQYYDEFLPRNGKILDFCSSWTSHYPERIQKAAAATTPENETPHLQITAMGLNRSELAHNPLVNNGQIAQDLNANPDVASALRAVSAIGPAGSSDLLEASTCVVSIDYLTDPVAVLRSVREATKPGGTVHLTVSNRCFPTKATRRWLQVDEGERVRMVGDFLHFAGWEGVEVVVLSDGRVGNGEVAGEAVQGNSLQGLMGFMGMRARDPLWVVRARNGEGESS